MKVLLFGATGMVGKGVLLECLEDHRITSVLAISRSPCGVTHPKLEEALHADFFDYASIQRRFVDREACFFCLGVSSIGMDEAMYRHLTFDLAVAAAQSIADVNADLTFCYVSGTGTDSTERGRVMWARIKGRTENALLALPFKRAYMFRPGYIQPLKGVRSKTGWYQAAYTVVGPIFGVMHGMFPKYVTTTVAMGRAMIHVAWYGEEKRVLETADINRIAALTA
jgi:uncharacterized protein YbjT (DUF2867 family)